jgi:hypothetical protein
VTKHTLLEAEQSDPDPFHDVSVSWWFRDLNEPLNSSFQGGLCTDTAGYPPSTFNIGQTATLTHRHAESMPADPR